MTLYRQLLLTMLLLFVMLFIGVYAVQFRATAAYLSAQQQTTVINTATALGLALTPYLERGDALGAEAVINTAFDGGFYKQLQLDLFASHTEINREHAAAITDIPAWFMGLDLFSGAQYEAILTSGWLQLGRLSIEGHSDPAYYQLWQVMSRQTALFALCFLGMAVLLARALRYLLAPLRAIEQQARRLSQIKLAYDQVKFAPPTFSQADCIETARIEAKCIETKCGQTGCSNTQSTQTQFKQAGFTHIGSAPAEFTHAGYTRAGYTGDLFGTPIPLPNTRELSQVVSAINTMSTNLALQFAEQAAEVDRLRRRAFWDPTSELGNRAYLMTQAQSWLSAGSTGALMLVRVDMLAELDQAQGFAARDQMIKRIATQLAQLCRRYGEQTISRLSPREFALLIPEDNTEHLLLLGAEINRRIRELVPSAELMKSAEFMKRAEFMKSTEFAKRAELHLDRGSRAAEELSVVGIAVLTEQDNASSWLSRADNALSQTSIKGARPVVIASGGLGQSLGRLAWKQLIETALRDDLFELSSQAVFAISGPLLHQELYISVCGADTRYSASRLLAMVERFQLGQQLDLHIIKRALQHLSSQPAMILAVNLTAYSCARPEFWQALAPLLEQERAASTRLLLELPESVFLQHKATVMEALNRLSRAFGVGWGIDHFGRHVDALSQLADIHPRYVKLHHGLSGVSAEDGGSAERGADEHFLAAVCRAAHHMGAQTIVTRVATRQQLTLLQSLHVDGYQGFVSPPQPLV